MKISKISLTEEELKQVKKDFNNGKVYTDGCFCGNALSNFREDLHVMIDFSCRKSNFCDSPYYKVNNVLILEKASKLWGEETASALLKFFKEDQIDLDIYKLGGKKLYIHDDCYNSSTINDVYAIRDDLRFDEKSLKKVQKRLFKYYKNSYGSLSDATFKDIEVFKYEFL